MKNEDLKCCGNCQNYQDMVTNKGCEALKKGIDVIPNAVCDNWINDNYMKISRKLKYCGVLGGSRTI